MAKLVLPWCAASVLLHALPLVASPLAQSFERARSRILPETSVEIALLPSAPERTGEVEAAAAGAVTAQALAVAVALVAPAPARAPRERLERVASSSRAATSAPATNAPAEATSDQSASALAEAAPAEESPVATAAIPVAGASAASAPFDAAALVASGSAAAAPSARTPAARDGSPGAAAEDPAAARARYLRTLRQRVLERREYPYRARRAGLQGTVCLRLSLDAAGRLSQLRATCGPSPQPLLEAALRAVRAAEPFGPLPSSLGNQLSVDLPVIFQLDAPEAGALGSTN